MIKVNLFPYPGSKRKELSHIINNLPEFNENTVFIDLFGGSGCISQHIKQLYPNIRVIYNDIDLNLCNVFRFMQNIDNKDKYNEYFESDIYNKEYFSTTLKKHREGNATTLEYLFLRQYIWRSILNKTDMPTTKNGCIVKKRKKNFDAYQKIWKDIEISNRKYSDLLDEFKNNENAVFYYDPPYLTSGYNYKNSECFILDDLKNLIFSMKTSEAKMILHIEFSGLIYKSFEDNPLKYIQVVYYKNYSMVHSSVPKIQNYVALCTNYNSD